MRTTRVHAVAVAACAVAAGCNGSPDARDVVAGIVAGDLGSGGTVRVAYGAHWAAGGQAAVDAAGSFEVPREARVAVAYVDANGNGEFDRFAEPSGACERSESGWHCQIAFQRTTLYRAITSRGDLENDKTFVFWEDFARDGRPVADSKVCLDARCTAVDKPPFLSASDAPVRVFSICGPEGFQPQDATIEREHHKTTVRVSRPDAARPSIVARHDNGLQIRVGSPFDRAIVWGGDVDPTTGDVRKVYWTSESSPVRIERSSAGVSAMVPEKLLTECGKRRCDIVVQLLAIADPSSDTLVRETEYRSAIIYSP